ncbi:MAG: DUF6029 family protein [Candidatus Kapaibacterium sp.]|jgi:hypothetical protein
MLRISLVVFTVLISTSSLRAQDGTVRADFELQAQTYRADSLIGAPKVPERMLTAGFLNLLYTKDNLSVGMRYEAYMNPLQGVDPRYSGSGIPYRFARYVKGDLDVTVGNFYEQFGSGMILRTYEERALGFDNSIDGVRVKSTALQGVTVTALAGRQRSFFALGPGIVRGADVDISVNDMTLFGDSPLGEDVRLTLGASFLSKYQRANDPLLNLPENVGAWAMRGTFSSGAFLLSAEFAHKVNDPSFTNNRTFNPGEGLFVTSTYSSSGLGVTLNFKRIDNMDFRSDRSAALNNLNLNFLPPLTKQHSYRLVTMYPYATQPNGEIGVQAEVVYTLPKGLLGGYGTTVTVNFSDIHSIDTTQIPDGSAEGPYRYSSKYFSYGRTHLFQDLNLEISHVWSKKFKSTFSIIRQVFNKNVVLGKIGYDSLLKPVFLVFEGTMQFNPKNALRFELQHMSVEDVDYSKPTPVDHGSWAFALAEITWNSHWFFSVFDEWNYGNEEVEKRIHYPSASVTYVQSGTRVGFGYGRQRAGVLCVGGVCRTVPAADGFFLSLTSTL